MDIFIYILMAISHVQFSIFSTHHRFNKTFVIVSYCAYGLFFIGFCFVPLMVPLKFLITFIINLVLYLITASGKRARKLFLFSTYSVIFTTFLGLVTAIKMITGPLQYLWQTLALITIFTIIQCIMYFILIPRFSKVENKIDKGWIRLVIGNVLFFGALFMQIMYPFHFTYEEPWRILVFLLTSASYMFSFELIFFNFKNIISLSNKEEERVHFEEMAYTDGLTSLLNKTSYEIHADELLKMHEKNGALNSALIVMDINDFKKINDTYGHLEGDETLKVVANCLNDVFNKPPFKPFRIGGDEFVVIVNEAIDKEIKDKINEFKALLEKQSKVKMSIGYAYIDYLDIDPIRTALKNADKNMYENKFRQSHNIDNK